MAAQNDLPLDQAPGYQGPPRDRDAVIRTALSDPDVVLQIISSYEAQLRGERPVPWREIDARAGEPTPRRRTA
jgi:hypothetical protein